VKRAALGSPLHWSSVDTLFDLHAAPSFDRDRLRDRLREFSARGVYIGGSSWKYEGWLDQIYMRSRYLTRGRFSKKLFEETCLQEYASVFPAVCGDFAFYQFPFRCLLGEVISADAGAFSLGV
jgi:hypothetical protein